MTPFTATTAAQNPKKRLHDYEMGEGHILLPNTLFPSKVFRVGSIEIVKCVIFRTNNVVTHHRKRTLCKGRRLKLVSYENA